MKLSNLNSNLTLTLSYLNPALNNSALGFGKWNTAHGIGNPTHALLESIMMWIQVLLTNTGIKYLESRIRTSFLWTWKKFFFSLLWIIPTPIGRQYNRSPCILNIFPWSVQGPTPGLQMQVDNMCIMVHENI